MCQSKFFRFQPFTCDLILARTPDDFNQDDYINYPLKHSMYFNGKNCCRRYYFRSLHDISDFLLNCFAAYDHIRGINITKCDYMDLIPINDYVFVKPYIMRGKKNV